MFPTCDTSPIAIQHILNARLSAQIAFLDRANAKPISGRIQGMLRLLRGAQRTWHNSISAQNAPSGRWSLRHTRRGSGSQPPHRSDLRGGRYPKQTRSHKMTFHTGSRHTLRLYQLVSPRCAVRSFNDP